MIKLLSFFLAFFSCASLYAQVDEHGNPVFNSVSVSEEYLGGFNVEFFYYTISNNIANKESSVFVSEKPTKENYIEFATMLPSDYFTINRGFETIGGIVLSKDMNKGVEHSAFVCFGSDPQNPKIVPCAIPGVISEHRAMELDSLKVDPNSKITDSDTGKVFIFNGKSYKVQPYELVKKAAIELARQLNAEIPPLKSTEADPVGYVKRESVNGGKLDFVKYLEDDGKTGYLFHGYFFQKENYAIFVWAKVVKRIGIKSSDEAVKLWEEVYQQKLTDSKKNILVKSFEDLPLE